MGYLSQKKKQHNIQKFLNFSTVLLTFIMIVILAGIGGNFYKTIADWQFQIYLFALFVLAFSIFTGFFWHSLWLFVIVFVGYMHLGASGNLFFNIESNGTHHLNIVSQQKTKDLSGLIRQSLKADADIIAVSHHADTFLPAVNVSGYYYSAPSSEDNFFLSRLLLRQSGSVKLSASASAGYVELSSEEAPLILINVDFQNVPQHELAAAYGNLSDFINMQDDPVVVVGNFGRPAWSAEFSGLLEKTGLEVKNRIILSDGLSLFNPFCVPQIHLLAYKGFGIEDIRFLPAKENPVRPLMFRVAF